MSQRQTVTARADDRAIRTELLEQRIEDNRAAQEVDLPAWIFERVRLAPDARVLELCCGTGGQSLPMLHALGERGRLAALDLSRTSLDTLVARAGPEHARKLTPIEASLDALSPALERSGFARGAFEHVFCGYGLYYATEPRRTLDDARTWLAPDGQMSIAGPYGPNNEALFALAEASGVTVGDAVRYSCERFMLETVVPWATLRFASVNVSTVVNPVRWTTPERVMSYWESTAFYDASRRPAFEALLARHFAEHDQFVNEKWIMLVQMAEPRAPATR